MDHEIPLRGCTPDGNRVITAGRQPMPVWKRLLVFAILTVVVCAILAVVFPAWLFWSGRREWQQTKTELAARGETLSLHDFIPAPVPDGQNFFNDPAWMELTDLVVSAGPDGWPEMVPRLPVDKLQLSGLTPPLTKEETASIAARFQDVDSSGGRQSAAWQIFIKYATTGSEQANRATALFVLQLLVPCTPMVSHVSDLAARPFARFPIRYGDGFETARPHLVWLLKCAQVLGVRARAELILGDPDSASRDITLLLRLPYTVETEPYLVSLLVRLSIINVALTDIALGIKSHQWKAEELEAFESGLSGYHLAQDFSATRRGERAGFDAGVDRIIETGDYSSLMLAGAGNQLNVIRLMWHVYGMLLFRSDEAFYSRVLQREIDNFDAASRSGFLSDDREYEAALLHMRKNPFTFFPHILSLDAFDRIEPPKRKVVMIQDQVIQTRLACALERYRLKHGSYPETLSALVPDFMPGIPNDILTDKPMIYHLNAPDKFLLYSVGWDRADNGGIPVTRGGTAGDWVWGTPQY